MFKASPEPPQVESTDVVGGNLMHQGIQQNSYQSQIADLQTCKQQIDHRLMDQLLICQWKLAKIDKLVMEY